MTASVEYASATTDHLLRLAPEEIWRYMMLFVEDTDLQVAVRVCRFFRCIATDQVLWRKVLLDRNPRRLEQLLFSRPQRPSRIDLATRCILVGVGSPDVLVRQLVAGGYVGSACGVRSIEAGKRIRWSLTQRSLRRLLAARPGFNELGARGVFPSDTVRHTNGSASPQATSEDESDSSIDSGDESDRISVVAVAVAPRIMPHLVNLSRAIRRDQLKHSLAARKPINDIHQQGFTKLHMLTSSAATAVTSGGNLRLLPAQIALNHRLAQRELRDKLAHRASVHDLESRKVLQTDPHTARIVCPAVKPKIRFYEMLERNAAQDAAALASRASMRSMPIVTTQSAQPAL